MKNPHTSVEDISRTQQKWEVLIGIQLMLKKSGLLIGICLFVTTVAFYTPMLRRIAVLQVKKLRTTMQMSTAARTPNIGDITLVDFRLPAQGNEVIQNLINDEIISNSIVGGPCKKLYICLHKPESSSTSHVLNYVSKLYSKVWNEAALKNIFDIQCCVVSDSLDGIVTRDEILELKNLTRIMTFETNTQEIVNTKRREKNLGDVEVIDVNATAQRLFEEYQKQPSVLVLDSHYEEQPREIPTYDRVALGGTFDNMHYGHCKLLTLAALCCAQRLTVGITGDSMLSQKSNAAMITDFSVRSNAVGTFIRSIKPKLELLLPELSDPFGPAITDPDIEAIVVSSETIRGAFKINSIREERGMKPLAVLVTYRTDSVVLSSTFIREKKQLKL